MHRNENKVIHHISSYNLGRCLLASANENGPHWRFWSYVDLQSQWKCSKIAMATDIKSLFVGLVHRELKGALPCSSTVSVVEMRAMHCSRSVQFPCFVPFNPIHLSQGGRERKMVWLLAIFTSIQSNQNLNIMGQEQKGWLN